MAMLARSFDIATTVRWAQRDEAAAVYRALASGFAADPAVRWMYPDARQYFRFFPRFAAAFGGVAVKRGTAMLSAGDAGAALWLPPGSTPDEEALATLFQDSVAEEQKPDLFSVFDEMNRHHPVGPHWYLPLIGVSPASQGEGHGSAMLALGLREADRTGLAAYLEATSARSVPLYERHGFKIIGEITIGTCPPIIPMVRQPRPLHFGR